MKQKIYILGLITVLLLTVGTQLKLNHYPGAAHFLTVGIILLVLVFLPLALINHYRAEGKSQNKLLYIVTWITAFVVFTAMLFKILHWPKAGIMLIVSLPFPYIVFLPVFLVTTSKIKSFNIFNTVFILLMLAVLSVFTALLALNVTRERIDESLTMSVHYNKMEKVLEALAPGRTIHSGKIKYSDVMQKADELLSIIEEAQKRLFIKAETTKEQWITDPGKSNYLDSRDNEKIMFRDKYRLAYRLEAGIKSLLAELEKTPGCEKLSAVAPKLFGYKEPGKDESTWAEEVFPGQLLAWVLIDLDAIRLNVISIKKEVSSLQEK
jgi:hypothetical protein